MQGQLYYLRSIMTQELQDSGIIFNKETYLFSKLLVFSKLDLNITVTVIIFD